VGILGVAFGLFGLLLFGLWLWFGWWVKGISVKGFGVVTAKLLTVVRLGLATTTTS
jgi:hypothetical protein